MSMTNTNEDNPNINHSGEYIAEKMRFKGLKNKDVAEKLGVSETAVSYWIHGVTRPDDKNLDKLAKLLGVTKSEIEQGHDFTPEEKTSLYNKLQEAQDQIEDLKKENAELKQKSEQLMEDNAKALHKINEVEEKGIDTHDTINLVLGLIMILMALTFLPQMSAEDHLLSELSLIVTFFVGCVVFVYGFVMFLKHQFFPRKK